MNVKFVVLNNLFRNINVCVLIILRVNVVGILRNRLIDFVVKIDV